MDWSKSRECLNVLLVVCCCFYFSNLFCPLYFYVSLDLSVCLWNYLFWLYLDFVNKPLSLLARASCLDKKGWGTYHDHSEGDQMSCFPLLIFYRLKRQRHQYSHVLWGLLAQAVCYLVRVQVSVGLSLHHMGSLIHGRVESQISSIVTVCWWVEQDWKWLPWQPVRSSTNLKNLFWTYAWLLSLTNSPWGKNLFVSAVLWYLLMTALHPKLCCCQPDRTLICPVYCYLLEIPEDSYFDLYSYLWTIKNGQTFKLWTLEVWTRYNLKHVAKSASISCHKLWIETISFLKSTAKTANTKTSKLLPNSYWMTK